MSIIIGLFILGAVLTFASMVFTLVIGIFSGVVASVYGLFAWLFRRR